MKISSQGRSSGDDAVDDLAIELRDALDLVQNGNDDRERADADVVVGEVVVYVGSGCQNRLIEDGDGRTLHHIRGGIGPRSGMLGLISEDPLTVRNQKLKRLAECNMRHSARRFGAIA